MVPAIYFGRPTLIFTALPHTGENKSLPSTNCDLSKVANVLPSQPLPIMLKQQFTGRFQSPRNSHLCTERTTKSLHKQQQLVEIQREILNDISLRQNINITGSSACGGQADITNSRRSLQDSKLLKISFAENESKQAKQKQDQTYILDSSSQTKRQKTK